MASAAERLLRTYCAKLINEEYDRMSSTSQETLQEAILTTVRQRTLVYQRGSRSSEQNEGHSQPVNSTNDPLAKILREIMPRLSPTMDLVKIIADLLSSWGAISSSISQYKQNVSNQRSQYDFTNDIHSCSTSSAVAKHTSDTITWNDRLRKIEFSDLVLFQTAKGCYIEGKIVGEPIQPMVGGITLIQETSTNNLLLICFYNVLPDGINGAAAEPLLKAEFPMGSTLRVAEPYYKIFGAGTRGVRIDTPSEIHVVDHFNQEIVSAKTAKQRGNDFVSKKQFLAAIDLYLKGLQTSSESDFVATLLSNRSQANIQMEDYISAICDAAASLTIRPKSPKTWYRYQKCLKQIQQINGTKKCELLSLVLESLNVSESTTKKVDIEVAQHFKQQGNEAFKNQSFMQSIDLYTKSLDNSALITQAMLNNWALCALKILNFGDAVAAAAASLRIGYNEKAAFRLINALSLIGDYDLAKQAFELIVGSSKTSSVLTDLKYQLDRCIKYRAIMIIGKADSSNDVVELFHNTPSCTGNWIHGCVQTFSTKKKGRGIRATHDLAEGSVVLVEWPLVNKAFRSDSNNLLISSNGKSKFHMGSSAELRSHSVHRLRREAVLAKIFSHLCDGEHTPTLVPVSNLLLNLELFPLLLPGHREYFETLNDDITADRVDKILDINCHGTSLSAENINCQTELYPTISMINHASDPNCVFNSGSLEFLCFIVTCKSIKAGEELTMKYQSDEVVKQKWGIQNIDSNEEGRES